MILRTGLFFVGVLVIAACSSPSVVSPAQSTSGPSPTSQLIASTAGEAVSPTPGPTVEAKDAYLALASRLNSKWMALGRAPSTKASADERQRYPALARNIVGNPRK